MLTPGSLFAGYRVERLLGHGGTGDVYLARHPRLPRSDALKLMSQELSRNEVYRRRFSAEADIASLIQHDSVVRVYDRGEDDGRLWLAMEYIEGRDLAHILASEGRLSLPRSVALVEQIAAGLDAIHARGLLHRDVRPANILVSRDVLGTERALLTEFGIARSVADSLGLTGLEDVVATLHYAAPEQFELRSTELDRRVDVYALGCVLYEMVTGRPPLEGATAHALWRVIQSEQPQPASQVVSGLPLRLDAVLARALAKRRQERYDSAGELARAARSAMAETAVTAPEDGPISVAAAAITRRFPLTSTPLPVAGIPPFEQLPLMPEPLTEPEPTAAPQAATELEQAGEPGPFRIGLRRDDPAVDRFLQFGPFDSGQLPEDDAQRLAWLISLSNVLTLPEAIEADEGTSSVLTVEMPGRVHTVAWRGQPPPALAELAADVERLAEELAPSPEAIEAETVQDAEPDADVPHADVTDDAQEPEPPRARRRWVLVLVASLVPIVIGVAATVVALRPWDTGPAAPGAVALTAGRGTVTVKWHPRGGRADHFVVYRDGRTVMSTVKTASFVDHPLDISSHRYAVQAVSRSGRASKLSAVVVGAAMIRPLTPAEQALRKQLPPGFVDGPGCDPILTGIDSHITTAISCAPAPGQTPKPPGVVPAVVEAFGAHDSVALKAAMNDEGAAHGARNGSCSSAPESGTWNFGETPTVVNGQIVCYTAASHSYLLFSYATAGFYVRISTTAPYADLYKYWQGAALHLP